MDAVRIILCSCRSLINVHHVPILPDGNHNRVALLAASLIGRGRNVQLAAVPFAGHERVVLDDRLLKRGHVALSGLDGGGEHGFVLGGGVVLRDHGGCRAVEGAGAAARRRVASVAGAGSAVGICGAGNASENGCRDLTVFFFLLQHFERDDLHSEIGAADVLDGFDLGDAKFGGLLSEIVDANDEHRPPVRLQLARGWTDQHQRMLLA